MYKREQFEVDLKKKLQFLQWRLKDVTAEKKNEYERGYLAGQINFIYKLLEIIKNGGL